MSPQWTQEQLAVLESSGVGLAVMAGAGAGKTTVLVEKCSRLLTSRPEARICAVSFTEKSAADLRLKLSKIQGLERHWVTTIHGLCGLILREFPDAVGMQGDERVLAEPEALSLWNEAVEALWFDERGPDDPETAALQRLLAREGREGLEALLARVRDLETAGIFAKVSKPAGGGTRPDGLPEGLEDLLATARRVVARYEELKVGAGGMDFSDLEKRAQIVLRNPQVRAELSRRFDLVLIDEFQDTNAVQAEILWNLAREDRSNLCVVGDPKQSIYRFRDADVSLFSELCGSLPRRLALTTNFRSDPEILEFVNRICAPVFEESGLEYQSLQAGKPRIEQSEGAVARLDVDGPEQLAAHLLACHRQGVPWEDMAILMRKIRGNERWIQALSRSGIPVAVGGGGLFWSDPRIVECVSLLVWWAFPADELSALGFLRAPWVALEDRQIDSWLRPASPKAARDLLQFWESENPVARSLSGLRPGRSPAAIRPAQLILRLLADPQVADRVAPLRQSMLSLVHRLEQMSHQGLGFFEVVAQARQLMRESRREKEIPPPRNRGVLPVLTVHASKGLEFEHVYLVDFGKKRPVERLGMLLWDRKEGAFLVGRDEFGDRVEDDPDFVEWKSREQKAVLAENKRQFYVALTRAKQKLVLVCEPLDPAKTPDKPPVMEHWRSWLEQHGRGLASVAPSKVPADQARSSEPEVIGVAALGAVGLERARHAVTEWTLLSRCERAYVRTVLGHASEPEPDSDSESEKNRDPWQPTGRLSAVQLGKRVHALLEQWARFPEARESVKAGLHGLESQVGGKRFSASVMLEWLSSTPWLDGAGISEWPFEWKVGGVSLVGAVDRLVELQGAPQGELVVVDYKVFSKLKDSTVVRELYGAQLELYAGAVDAFCRSRGLDRRVRAVLVQIAPEGVEELEVELNAEAIRTTPPALATRARELVEDPAQGEKNPRRQESCRFCPHMETCQ